MGIAAQPTRENRTITVDFRSEATYFQLLGDGKAFLECVIAFVMSLGFQLKHKATCRGGGYLTRHSHDARANLANISWLFVTFDTDGEVFFATASTLTHQVFIGLPNMNRRYFGLRHQYHFW